MNDSLFEDMGRSFMRVFLFPAIAVAGLYAGTLPGCLYDVFHGRWPIVEWSPWPLVMLLFIVWHFATCVAYFAITMCSVVAFLMVWLTEEPRIRLAGYAILFASWAILPRFGQ